MTIDKKKEPRRVTAVTLCTECGKMYEGIHLDGILPCGHEPHITCKDVAVVEAVRRDFEEENRAPEASSANARKLVAYGKASNIKSIGSLLSSFVLMLLSWCWLFFEPEGMARNIFTAFYWATFTMAFWKNFPGQAITSIWANRICPPKMYDKITAYLVRTAPKDM